MDGLLDIKPTTVITLLGLFLLLGVLLILLQLRKASSSKKQWAQLGYRPVAGGSRSGLGRHAAHYVRSCQSFEVHYVTSYKAGYGKTEMAVSWICPLPASSLFELQVVEAELAAASLGARVSKALNRYKYNWQPLVTERIHINDKQLDRRFAVFGIDQAAADSLLSDPDLRSILLSLSHVDLTVAQDQVRFQDPFNVNLWGLSGRALVDLHNKIAEILVRTAAATQAA